MNPNSQHQLWSRWILKVTVPGHLAKAGHHDDPRVFRDVKTRFAREASRLFGSVGQGRVDRVAHHAVGNDQFTGGLLAHANSDHHVVLQFDACRRRRQ